MEGGGEHATVKRAAIRSSALTFHAGERRDQGHPSESVHPSAHVAGNDAALIGEREQRAGAA